MCLKNPAQSKISRRHFTIENNILVSTLKSQGKKLIWNHSSKLKWVKKYVEIFSNLNSNIKTYFSYTDAKETKKPWFFSASFRIVSYAKWLPKKKIWSSLKNMDHIHRMFFCFSLQIHQEVLHVHFFLTNPLSSKIM